MNMIANSIFMRAARGESTERLPIWLMRQAGRCDPAYRALRKEIPLPLEELFRHTDIAAQISLLPLRWGVDAIIFFQDILSPLSGMGAPFVFRPGPQPAVPLDAIDALEKLHSYDMADEMPFVAEIFRLLRTETGTTMPLLGFAGAPLTLLAFLAEGGSPPSDLPRTRAVITEAPHAARRILDTLTDMTIDYLRYQMASGADAVQLFESAAQYFTPEEYRQWALPSQQRIFDALRGQTPTIFFARLTDNHIPVAWLAEAGADILSLHGALSIREARRQLGADQRIQGNLDNQLLVHGSHEAIAHEAARCIEEGESRGHIFNLCHGILAETPFDNVRFLVDFVKSR